MDFENFKLSSDRLAEALERALRHWQKRREAEVALGPLTISARPPFTIALSCEAGANGPAVACAVGERLGWQVFDHELVEWIAREMGVRAELLRSVDEKRMNWLLGLIQGFTSGPAVSEEAYVLHLAETLFYLAAHGECIIVGRGAAQVLPPETTLRVRMIGPLKDRIAAIQHRYGTTPEEAARWVEQTDRERKDFVQAHFFKDPSDPHQYDLLLEAFRFPAAQCAELIVTALHLLRDRTPSQASPASADPTDSTRKRENVPSAPTQ